MTAEHETDGVAYDGMDALMAAITGEPLPPDAHRDPLRRAEHRAAEADVTTLKNQLTWLAEALTGEPQTRGAAGTGAPGAAGETPAPGTARGMRAPAPARDAQVRGAVTDTGAPGAATDARASGAAQQAPARDGGVAREAPARDAGVAGGETETPGGGVGAQGSPRAGAARARSLARPAGASRPRRPGRPSGRHRVVRVALRSFAGAAACCVALGFGWLVTHSPGDAASGGKADSGAKSAADAPAEASGDGGRPPDPVRDLACSRLVVEGTVVGVDPGAEPHGSSSPHGPASWSRITLSVIRSYKPAHGPAEVGFLLAGGAEPAPREGQHVLVQVDEGRPNATRWIVGDARVAAERARITEALPASGHTPCPSGGPS
ncbi:hypothetical protein ACGFT2_20000 [Streptomyces sp. NPDC048514]|uniref:hypothetical protein n=1 Tax=Streptomyces sp. NPDC048514 TaxID=3365564 RepID=UPI00371FBDE5